MSAELSPEAIREQLALLTEDPAFRSSRRSVQFLRYVVEQTLQGSAGQIKERAIGAEVFGREPAYDTNVDHVVRTAAIELRKRLAIYYGKEQHRHELRMSLVPGSYIPRFAPPSPAASVREPDVPSDKLALPVAQTVSEPEVSSVITDAAATGPIRPAGWSRFAWFGAACVAVVLVLFGLFWRAGRNAQDLFWKPVLETPGPVLLAVGDVPNGPPTPLPGDAGRGDPFPVIHKTTSSTVPFADALTMARIMSVLAERGKEVSVRREGLSSFSELREHPVVLIGAFNNVWSLRLTQRMRYSLALDPDRHLVYIRDSKDADSRKWSWSTNQSSSLPGSPGGPVIQDYALISRIWNSETGHAVIVVGGLYTYGTQAAGEFLTDKDMMEAVRTAGSLKDSHRNIQMVLRTTVTDGTPGPPVVIAVWTG